MACHYIMLSMLLTHIFEKTLSGYLQVTIKLHVLFIVHSIVFYDCVLLLYLPQSIILMNIKPTTYLLQETAKLELQLALKVLRNEIK